MRPESEIRAEFNSNAVLSSYPGAFDRRRGYIEGYRAAEQRFAEWVREISDPIDIDGLRYVTVQIDRDAYQEMMKEFGR